MRNLNEYQAEVFRRSEERIKQRRQRRNRILFTCIPLVLCITMASAFFLPEKRSKEPESPPGAGNGVVGGLTGEKYESMSTAISKITLSGLGYDKTYEDISDVRLISNHLLSYGSRGNETHEETNTEITQEGGNDNFDSITDSADTGYTITLFMSSGQKTEYHLDGNTLKNLTANQTYALSKKQANELKYALSVPLS